MRLLLLFLEEPLPGQVMGRIAESAGPEAAVRSYRAMVRVLLRQLSGLEDCHLRICYAPDDAHEGVRFWILPEIIDQPDLLLDPSQIDFVPQGPGDRRSQLEHHFANAFEEGHKMVAAIGADCIDLSARWINAAFSQLNGRYHGAVGPTPSGRCHLLALRAHQPELFSNVVWEDNVVPSLLKEAEDNNQPLYQLPPLVDIQTEGDFKKALLGPLGSRLRKAMKALADDGF